MNGCHIKPEQFFNLIFGYNAIYAESGSDLNPGAGTVVQTMSAVPAGEIWILQQVSLRNTARGARMIAHVYNGTTEWDLIDQTTGAAGVRAIWTGAVVMQAGDYIRLAFYATTAGDDLYWQARGYKMKVSQ
jgi:hypothetical protein